MKISPSHYVYLLFLYTLGTTHIEVIWTSWESTFNACDKRIVGIEYIFCAKFVSSCGGFEPCQEAWCVDYYKLKENGEHSIKRIVEEYGSELDTGEIDQFTSARTGDSCVTMFQC